MKKIKLSAVVAYYLYAKDLANINIKDIDVTGAFRYNFGGFDND